LLVVCPFLRCAALSVQRQSCTGVSVSSLDRWFICGCTVVCPRDYWRIPCEDPFAKHAETTLCSSPIWDTKSGQEGRGGFHMTAKLSNAEIYDFWTRQAAEHRQSHSASWS